MYKSIYSLLRASQTGGGHADLFLQGLTLLEALQAPRPRKLPRCLGPGAMENLVWLGMKEWKRKSKLLQWVAGGLGFITIMGCIGFSVQGLGWILRLWMVPDGILIDYFVSLPPKKCICLWQCGKSAGALTFYGYSLCVVLSFWL